MDSSPDSQLRIHYIYAIALSNTPYIHVHHTTVDKVGRFYTKNTNGKIGATAPMAKQAIQEGRHLSMFLLEKYKTDSGSDAYHRCIAWQKLAVEAGYTPQSPADHRHLSNMNNSELSHYETLRYQDVRALCSPEWDLAPGILARRRGPQNLSKNRSTRVIMPQSTHSNLSKRAACHGLKLSDYLLRCATDASPGVDLSEIIALRAELQQALSLIRSVVVRPELTKSDIHALLNASHHISTKLATVTQCLANLASNY